MKKLLSILLACVMLLGLIAPVFAEDGEQPATDPAAVTDTTEPEDPAEEPSNDPADVTDPAYDPENPTEDPADDPADVTDPVDPDDPTDDPAEDPSDPAEDPDNPTDPEDPSDPTDPVVDPENPEDPTDPEDPAENPEDPEDPAEDPNAEIDLEEIDDDRNDAGETTYALWDANTKTLTLYYGTLPSTYAVKGFGYSSYSNGPFYSYRTATSVVIDPSFANARPTTLYGWFLGFSKLLSIEGLQYLNTSSAVSMRFMFSECYSITELDVSHFDTSNVVDMCAMFQHCTQLTSLDLSNFNTANVTDISSMFAESYNLQLLNVTSFNTSKVQNMHGTFGGCSSLKSLDVSNFDTSNVTSMAYMFAGSYQGGGPRVLTFLDLSSFDTRNVKRMQNMFWDCNQLDTIIVDGSKWSTAAVTSDSDMFTGCNSLVGGKGTVVSSSGKTYARIDEVGNPGYLTDIADKSRLNLGTSETQKQFYAEEIVTQADGVVYAKLPKNSYPRFSTTNYPILLDPQYQNYIFAGYFKNIGSGATTERTATETTGYARFIPIEVLDVYVQFRHTSLAASDPQNKTDLRFLTSVPDPATLGYNGQIVGFRLVNLSNGKVISDAAFGAEYCYDEIIGDYKVQTGSGLVSLTPDKFYSGVSKKVALQTVIGMPNSYFENQKRLSVQPYIITLDGTKSYATVHPFMLKIVNGKKTAAPIANN